MRNRLGSILLAIVAFATTGCEQISNGGNIDARSRLSCPSNRSCKCAQSSCDWNKQYSSSNATESTAFAVDLNTSFYLGGNFSGKLNVDGSELYSKETASFITKLDVDGRHLWSKQCAGSIVVDNIATSNWCEVTIAAQSSNPLDIDTCIPVPQNIWHDEPSEALDAAGGEIFLATFDDQGTFVMGHRFHGRSIDLEYDFDGNLFVSGFRRQNQPFDGESNPRAGWFVAKLDRSYLLQWVAHFGLNGQFKHAVSEDGHVFVAGSFDKTMQLGASELASEGGVDLVVLKLDRSDGSIHWYNQFGGPGDSFARGIDVDSQNNPVVVASFTGTMNQGDDPTFHTPSGSMGALLVKLHGDDGSALWHQEVGSVEDDGHSLGVHAVKDETLLSGPIHQQTNAGECSTVSSRLIKFDSKGQQIVNVPLNLQGAPDRSEIATLPNGQVFAAGNFSQTMDLGCGVLEAGSKSALFVAKLDAKLNPTGAP